MNHQHQPARSVRPRVEPDGVEHPARGRVEPRHRVGALPVQVAVRRHRGQHLGGRDRSPRRHRQTGALDGPGAQHVVTVEQRVDHGRQCVRSQSGRGVHGHGLEEPGEPGPSAVDVVEPGQDRCCGNLADRVDGGRVGRRGSDGEPGQRGGRAQGEDVTRTKSHAPLPGPADQAHRHDAVAAEGEEVGVGADHRHAEHLGEDVAHRLLAWIRRADDCSRGRRRRGGERAAVDLAVRGHREPVEHQHRGRHHVPRQLRGAPRQEVGLVQVDVGDDVTRQLRAARGGLAQHDGGVPNQRMRRERDLDLLEFDPHAADLDLIVGAAEEFEHAVGRPPREVTGAVHPRAVVVEGVGDEP